MDFDELRRNGRQNQLPGQILLQIDLSWGLYDQISSKIWLLPRQNGTGEVLNWQVLKLWHRINQLKLDFELKSRKINYHFEMIPTLSLFFRAKRGENFFYDSNTWAFCAEGAGRFVFQKLDPETAQNSLCKIAFFFTTLSICRLRAKFSKNGG